MRKERIVRAVGIIAAGFLLITVPAAQSIRAESAAMPASQYTLSQNEFSALLQEINTLIEKGTLLDAKENCKLLLRHELSETDHKKVQALLESINMKILFSPILTPDSFLYTVQTGDSLYEIARKHNTTIELIKKMNGLKTDSIQIGKKLKLTKAKFSIQVDKSENKLWLYDNEELLKTYSVATGRNNSTPVGEFTIETKVEHPTWYTKGAVIPPGNPKNILGTRWLGFSIPEYGIHGTTMPETIGAQASHGCVRMLNNEVEELYTVIPLKTHVIIHD